MALPGVYVGSLYFSGPQATGWIESLAFNSTVANVAAAAVKLNALAGLRGAWLSQDCKIIAAITRQVGPPRDSVASAGPFPVTGSITENCNTPDDCFEFRLQAASSVRTYQGHGIADSWISNGAITPAGLTAYIAAATAWETAILGGDWAIKRFGAVTPKIVISSIITPLVGDPATLTTAAAHGLTGIQTVQVRGYRGDPNHMANGIWRASVIGATTMQLLGSQRYQFNVPPGGTVQVLSGSIDPITNKVGPKGETRHVGRPFNLHHGKGPVRVRHS